MTGGCMTALRRLTWADGSSRDYTARMNGGEPASTDALRHRLLEGVLLRLARLPDADAFVLRGGMLLRLWFRPLPRPAGDLDLVSTVPFDVDETARRLVPLLADRGVDDGVTFDAERFRI